MKIPITEHPSFLEEKYKWRRWCRQNEETYSNSFNQGGKSAQTILSEIHKNEMEEFACEFAEWATNNGYCFDWEYKRKWEKKTIQGTGFDTFSTIETKTTIELLELFRKEREK